MFDTIADCLAADLRDLFLSDEPVSRLLIPQQSILLRFETVDVPSPRVVFLAGDATRISGQFESARVPFIIEHVSSLDRVTPDIHRSISGKIHAWINNVRSEKRRGVIWSKTYLHDLYNNQPQFVIDDEEREQVTRFRGEAIVTLAETTF